MQGVLGVGRGSAQAVTSGLASSLGQCVKRAEVYCGCVCVGCSALEALKMALACGFGVRKLWKLVHTKREYFSIFFS